MKMITIPVEINGHYYKIPFNPLTIVSIGPALEDDKPLVGASTVVTMTGPVSVRMTQDELIKQWEEATSEKRSVLL